MEDFSAFRLWQQQRRTTIASDEAGHVQLAGIPEFSNVQPNVLSQPSQGESQPSQPESLPDVEAGTLTQKEGKTEAKVVATKKRKRSKKTTVDLAEEEEEEEDNSRWIDTHVHQLIQFRSDLDLEFAAAAGKQGVNTWLKVQRMMIISCPGFRKTHSACKKKWDAEYKKYKEDKRWLSISGNNRLIQCKFFEEIDMAYANRANVKKIVHHDAAGSANPNPLVAGDLAQPTGDGNSDKETQPALRTERKEVKKSATEKLCGLLGEMVESTKAMAKTVDESGKVFQKFDAHMERLIDKL